MQPGVYRSGLPADTTVKDKEKHKINSHRKPFQNQDIHFDLKTNKKSEKPDMVSVCPKGLTMHYVNSSFNYISCVLSSTYIMRLASLVNL